MSMEPQTGHVKAWVGGINYKHFQYDHVKQGKRQIGSTFQAFFICNCDRSIKIVTMRFAYPMLYTVLSLISMATLTLGVQQTQVINMEGLEH